LKVVCLLQTFSCAIFRICHSSLSPSASAELLVIHLVFLTVSQPCGIISARSMDFEIITYTISHFDTQLLQLFVYTVDRV